MLRLVKYICVIMAMLLVMAVSCCGFSQTKKIEGSWTLSTINGATLEVYTAATGYSADLLDRNVEINGEKMIVSGMDSDEISIYGIKAVSGGFELTENNTTIGTASYSEKDGILTLVLPDPEEDLVFTFTLKRGTYNYNES